MSTLIGVALVAGAFFLIWYGQKGYLPVQGTRTLPQRRFEKWRHSGRFYLNHPLKFVSLVLGAIAGVAGFDMIF